MWAALGRPYNCGSVERGRGCRPAGTALGVATVWWAMVGLRSGRRRGVVGVGWRAGVGLWVVRLPRFSGRFGLVDHATAPMGVWRVSYSIGDW